jgi:hypothetical protein
MLDLRRMRIIGAAVAMLAGCGGGGGGASDPPPTADPDAPTFSITAFTSPVTASEEMSHAIDHVSRIQSLARFAVDLAHRFAVAPVPPIITANCAYTGRIEMRLEDLDGDGRASAGDTITASLDNCGVPRLGRAANGQIQLQLLGTGPSAAEALRALLTIRGDLGLERLLGGPNQGLISTGIYRGALSVEWSETATEAMTRIASAPADDLSFTSTSTPGRGVDRMQRLDILQTLSYEQARITNTFAYRLLRGSSGNSLQVRTTQDMTGDLNVAPRSFAVEAEGRDGWRFRIEPEPSGTGPGFGRTRIVDPRGGEASSRVSGLDWNDLKTLATDARTHGRFVSYSDQGAGYESLVPWHDTSVYADIDRACQQGAVAGVTSCRADALFQRPVAAQTGVTTAGFVTRLQFGRALASNTPPTLFRWTDSSNYEESGTRPWSVATTAERRGALFVIRAHEPLRRARAYGLEASVDGGTTWSGPQAWLDPQGGIVNLAQPIMGSAYTAMRPLVETHLSDLGLVSALVPARLRAGVTLEAGRSVRSVRWAQIAGPALRLADPSAAETEAAPFTEEPRPIEDAVFQVTVTDDRGDADHARVTLKVGNRREVGAALYTETGTGWVNIRKRLETGAGSIFYGPTAGDVSPRVVGQDEGGTGTSFSVLPAWGEPLRVGLYADAVNSRTPGPQHGLVSRIYCPSGDPVSGWFEVLEVAYAADGTLTRLAIDFYQRCETGTLDYQKGSYRLNSTVPLRP